MTESEWLTCNDPQPMLRWLEEQKKIPSDRKLRLWCAAVAKQNTKYESFQDEYAEWSLGNPDSCEGKTETSPWALAVCWGEPEKYDCSQQVKADLLREIVGNPFRPIDLDKLTCNVCGGIYSRAEYTICADRGCNGWMQTDRARWCTTTVTDLAQHAWDTGDFSGMPYLGDALKDANCTSQDILEHCRRGKEHVRGCWTIDLILGLE